MYDDELDYDMDFDNDDDWELVERKSVKDSDDFWTDYTLWHNKVTDEWACIFGDSDLYYPGSADFDAEFDSEEAREWFDCYNGFEEDDIFTATDDVVVGLEGMMHNELIQFLYDAFLAADPSHEELDIYVYEEELKSEYESELANGWFEGSFDNWLVDRAQDVIDDGYPLSDEFLDSINESRREINSACNDKPVDDKDARENITSSVVFASTVTDDLDVVLGELINNLSKIQTDVDDLTPAGVDSIYEEVYKMNRKIRQLMRIHF